MVEENAARSVQAVRLTVVDSGPVRHHLRARVGRARVEGRRFLLRGLDHFAVLLGRRSLVVAHLLAALLLEIADRFEQFERAHRDCFGGVDRHIERDTDVGLSAEVVNLVRAHFAHQLAEVVGVAEVAVVQLELAVLGVRVLIDAVDAAGIERRGAPDDAVHFVALAEKELGEVGTILTGDTGDQSATRGGHSANLLNFDRGGRLPCRGIKPVRTGRVVRRNGGRGLVGTPKTDPRPIRGYSGPGPRPYRPKNRRPWAEKQTLRHPLPSRTRAGRKRRFRRGKC